MFGSAPSLRQEMPGAVAEERRKDAGTALLDQVLNDANVQRLQQLFPAMVAFLEETEAEVPHGCQIAVRDARLKAGVNHDLREDGQTNVNTARHY